MSIIQALASGPVTFRLARDQKTLTLRSPSPISAPEIFAGCPVPEPPAPPTPEPLAGAGPWYLRTYPTNPADLAINTSGLLVSTSDLSWDGGTCAPGADLWLDLEPGALEWSPLVQGLSLESTWAYKHSASEQQQSTWLGLANADRSTLIAWGRVGQTAGFGAVWGWQFRLRGSQLASLSANVLANPSALTADRIDLPVRFDLRPSSTGARTPALRVFDPGSATWAVNNDSGAIATVSAGQWAQLVQDLADGLLRPVFGVTHRAGGVSPGAKAYWPQYLRFV